MRFRVSSSLFINPLPSEWLLKKEEKKDMTCQALALLISSHELKVPAVCFSNGGERAGEIADIF